MRFVSFGHADINVNHDPEPNCPSRHGYVKQTWAVALCLECTGIISNCKAKKLRFPFPFHIDVSQPIGPGYYAISPASVFLRYQQCRVEGCLWGFWHYVNLPRQASSRRPILLYHGFQRNSFAIPLPLLRTLGLLTGRLLFWHKYANKQVVSELCIAVMELRASNGLTQDPKYK